MRHILTLQESVQAADAGGGFTTVWENVTANPLLYAAIQQSSGGERFAQNRLVATVTCRIVIRHRADVTPEMRLIGGGRIYNIVSVMDRDGRQAFLDIVAEMKDS